MTTIDIPSKLKVKFLRLITNPAFAVAAANIIMEDMVVASSPSPKEPIVSFEVSLLYFLISKQPSLVTNLPTKNEIKPMEEQIRKLLSELQHFLMYPSQYNPVRQGQDLLQRITQDIHSESNLTASFLYSGDEAYPSQYFSLIPKRYAKDELWLKGQVGLNTQDMQDCADYLITQLENALPPAQRPSLSNLLVDIQNLPAQLSSSMPIFIRQFATPLNNPTELSLKNILLFESRPIIQMDKNTLLLPPTGILLRAVCESPLYWMLGDKSYAQQALQHRGETSEDIVFNWMSYMFGKECVFKDVLVKRHGRHITDIDVLAFFQNKALIFQIKSKKATLKTKLGDYKSYKEDFEKSIQAAYNQAIASVKAIKSRDCQFFIGKQQDLQLIIPKETKDFFIFCITTEQFKTLAFRIDEFLQKDTEYSDIPVIAVSLFDLQLLTLYLYNAYDFLYYLHRRQLAVGHIQFSEEINILIAFLYGMLVFPKDGKSVFLNYFTDELNVDFTPWPTKEMVDSRLRWKIKKKEEIIRLIEQWTAPATNDLISFIYDHYKELSIARLQALLRISQPRIFELLKTPETLLEIIPLFEQKIGRNELCPCRSGIKYKRCCGKKN